MWRYRFALAAIWLLAAAGGGVAWLTHHPESRLIDQAAEAPWIGPLAAKFRDAYRGPEPGSGSTGSLDRGLDGGSAGDPDERAATAGPQFRGESIWVPEGTPLRRGPDPGSPVESTLERHARLPLIERQGDWYRVLDGRRDGWARLERHGRPGVPPLGSDPEPVLPLRARPPDAAQLVAGLTILGPAATADRLGPYRLFTDVADAEVLRLAARVATEVEEVYAERYGVVPVGEPAEAVLLFSRLEGYRDFQHRFERLAGLPSSGHVASGIVALWAGDRSPRQVAATLVHELVHLLNRRALGPALPPWLDEGLADDLAMSRLDESGGIRPEQLGGEIALTGHLLERSGGLASARLLESWIAAGGVEPLPELLALDWESFVAPEREGRSYVLSALWIRFLLGGPDERLAAAFRSYLAAVAAGGPATPDELRRRLGRGWEELDAAFARWGSTELRAHSG